MAKPYTFSEENRPVCETCNKRFVARTTHAGKPYWRKYCQTCAKSKYTPIDKKHEIDRKASIKYYLKYKERKMNPCTMCGFEPKHSCQMDWDHIDGNRYNNDPSNRQLLCANCHRLKTVENGDIDSTKYIKKGITKAVAL